MAIDLDCNTRGHRPFACGQKRHKRPLAATLPGRWWGGGRQLPECPDPWSNPPPPPPRQTKAASGCFFVFVFAMRAVRTRGSRIPPEALDPSEPPTPVCLNLSSPPVGGIEGGAPVPSGGTHVPLLLDPDLARVQRRHAAVPRRRAPVHRVQVLPPQPRPTPRGVNQARKERDGDGDGDGKRERKGAIHRK